MGGSALSVTAVSHLQGGNNASDKGAKPIAFQTNQGVLELLVFPGTSSELEVFAEKNGKQCGNQIAENINEGIGLGYERVKFAKERADGIYAECCVNDRNGVRFKNEGLSSNVVEFEAVDGASECFCRISVT